MLTVLKTGGNVLAQAFRLDDALEAFGKLHGPKVLVHGGGRAATSMAERLGIEAKMIDGRRITDEAMLEVVTMVYGGLMNKRLVAKLQAMGLNALGLTGADLNLMQAHKRVVGEIDYGWVGDIDRVNITTLLPLLDAGIIPVVAPLTHDNMGNLLNTNADTIASELGIALARDREVRILYTFELPGVMTDPMDPSTVVPEMSPDTYRKLKNDGIILGGMIPKLDNAFAALTSGVKEVLICQAPMAAQIGSDHFVGTVLRL